MILQSLVRYYEILADDPDSGIPKQGYCRANVSYALNLSPEGELLNVIPLKVQQQRGKKLAEVPRSMEVPEQQRRVGCLPYFLCDHSTYLFGVDNKDNSKRADEYYQAAKNLHLTLLEAVDCPEARAIVNYYTNWQPQAALQHPALQDYLDEILSGANLVFHLDGGGFAHQTAPLRTAWQHCQSQQESFATMTCLDSATVQPVARTHPIIKGINKAQAMGVTLISFFSPSYCSYGRDGLQGLNAPVSEYAAFAYTTALNHLLADSARKQTFGDATVVCWAESSKPVYRDSVHLMFNPSLQQDSESENAVHYDKAAVQLVSGVLKRIAEGSPVSENPEQLVDPDTRFYVLGLSPNAARLAIRFFITDSFGGFIQKTAQHYADLQLEHAPFEPAVFPVWKLLSETVSPKSTDKASSPLLSGAVLRAILTGSAYPAALYNAVLLRIKAERDISYYKAAIIKAYLLRKYRDNPIYKEVLTVALNEQSDNKAYLLGRLFAVLEKAQQDANPGINATIKDRYFTSACAAPASVFPILLRLSQHHISKAQYGYVSDRKIAELMEKLDVEKNSIPAHLSLEEQGIFILGYYHQRNANFTKNNKGENDDE